MRKRLTKRAQDKKAELTDPNQLGREDRKNPELKKYETHKFVEDHPLPNMNTEWKKDKRNEVGLPAPLTAAQKAAAVHKVRKERERFKVEVSKKAEACLKLAELFLPDADEKIAEDQAVELMDLPTSSIINLLRRKYEVLEKDAGSIAGPGIPDGTGPRGGTPECPLTDEEKEATEDEEEKEATEEEEKDKEEEEKEATEEEEATVEATDEEATEEDAVSFGDEDAILDQIFTPAEVEPTKASKKEGAKKLGTVKKASTGVSSLERLWKSDPDVSDAFRS